MDIREYLAKISSQLEPITSQDHQKSVATGQDYYKRGSNQKPYSDQ